MIEVDAWELGCMSLMALIAFVAAVCYLAYWIYDELTKGM